MLHLQHKAMIRTVCSSALLSVCFLVSCSGVPDDRPAMDTTETDIITQVETIPEDTAPEIIVEPSQYEGYTAAFGDNSLQTALAGVTFEDLSERDKEVIQQVMSDLGGLATITEESVTLALNGQSAIIYYDGTTTLIDTNGNAGGTRWLNTELSALIKPLDGCELVLCLSSPNSFAAKYKCDSWEVYRDYCISLNTSGWVTESFSDVMMSAHDKDNHSLTISFHEGVFTIMLQTISNGDVTT